MLFVGARRRELGPLRSASTPEHPRSGEVVRGCGLARLAGNEQIVAGRYDARAIPASGPIRTRRRQLRLHIDLRYEALELRLELLGQEGRARRCVWWCLMDLGYIDLVATKRQPCDLL